ncbi:hypothetical protein AAVH_35418, partial [Aphelenchoides avenae]
ITNPLVLFVLPLGGGLVVLVTGFGELRIVVASVASFVSLIPTFNAVSTIVLIKSYRRSVLNALACSTWRKTGRVAAPRPPQTIGSFTSAELSLRE